eukprot:13733358-Alexandrium_andersonii.AAC.1
MWQFEELLFLLCRAMRVHEKSPMLWQASAGCQIDKQNGKDATDGIRVVNGLDPMGRLFYNTLWGAADHQAGRFYAWGYAKNRSRVSPII